MSKIIVRIVGGKCQGKVHKIGEFFEIDCENSTTPQGLCLSAFNSISPYVMVLLCNGEFSWQKTKTKTRVHCPDPRGIVLEIEKTS